MSERRKWQILREDKVYETNWLSVHDYDVIAPTGHQGVYGKVHIKQFAIGVLPVDENGFTYLVGQERFCFDQYSWELPEGGGKFTDPPLETARRELAEETNLAAKHFIPIFSNAHFSNSMTDEIGYAFLAHDLYETSGKPDETEDLSLRHLPLKEVFSMANQGLITDLFTLAMLWRAYHLAHTSSLPADIASHFRDI